MQAPVLNRLEYVGSFYNSSGVINYTIYINQQSLAAGSTVGSEPELGFGEQDQSSSSDSSSSEDDSAINEKLQGFFDKIKVQNKQVLAANSLVPPPDFSGKVALSGKVKTIDEFLEAPYQPTFGPQKEHHEAKLQREWRELEEEKEVLLEMRPFPPLIPRKYTEADALLLFCPVGKKLNETTLEYYDDPDYIKPGSL